MSVEIDMTYYVCPGCGILYALPESFAKRRADTYIFCPNGHRLLDGKDVLQTLLVEAAFARDQRDEANRDAEDLRRTVSALKGVITRLRNGH